MSTRDPADVLRERTSRLEAELRAVEERRTEAASLTARKTRIEGELEKSRDLLDRFGQGKKRTALPMLDDVRIASPCSANWSEMQGDAKVRYCGKCEKNVYDLSAMTREEAETTLLAREGELCVRFYRRTDGTLLTQDCPVGVRRKRMRLAAVLAVASGLTTAAAAFFGLVVEEDECEPPPPIPYVMSATPPPPVVEPVVPAVREHRQGGAMRVLPPDEPKPTKPQLHPTPTKMGKMAR